VEIGARMTILLLWLLRLGLAVVFVYAGAMKLADPTGFAREIDAYRLIPEAMSDLMAVYLPWLEIAIGAGVLLPWTVRSMAVIQMGLMIVFIVALSSAWWRGLDIKCGCFGASAEPANYTWLIGRDVFFWAGSCLVLLTTKSSDLDEEPAMDQIASPNVSTKY